jgi:hypothetical protein
VISDTATLNLIFGDRASWYFEIVARAIRRASSHKYSFISDDFFDSLTNIEPHPIGMVNLVLVHELSEKCHLSAITAVLRNADWIDGCCREFSARNLLGFAACLRGLLESVGDSMDGLMDIASGLAEHNRELSSFLTGKREDVCCDLSAFEKRLDHFMFAGWRRGPKSDVKKAKENHDYVANLENGKIENVTTLYRRLCSITHPSVESLTYLYKTQDEDGEEQNTIININGSSDACDALFNQGRISSNIRLCLEFVRANTPRPPQILSSS